MTFTAGSFDLLIAGWETVGLTSVVLIAFFNQRAEPVRNSLRVFAVYKVTDIGLLVGVFLLHHFAGSASAHALFHGEWPAQNVAFGVSAATLVGSLFVFAAAGKSAQFPFSGWLPRAMEGPTPSSAIFYGAIAVHMGIDPSCDLFCVSPWLPFVVVALGLVTALQATLSCRVASDAKTELAYAALAQVGVIFMEVGFGFERLALVHTVGHAAVSNLAVFAGSFYAPALSPCACCRGRPSCQTGVHYEARNPPSAFACGFIDWH